MPTCKFDQADLIKANEDWGCNCGPASLAFALQVCLEDVRNPMMLAGFALKRHTTPTIMNAALVAMGVQKRSVKVPVRTTEGGLDIEPLFNGQSIALVRIQWTGPWTKPGTNQKWAYRQTHWVATWQERGVPLVFDCNGGIRSFDGWEMDIVPKLTSQYSRADGGWFPTHIWKVQQE